MSTIDITRHNIVLGKCIAAFVLSIGKVDEDVGIVVTLPEFVE